MQVCLPIFAGSQFREPVRTVMNEMKVLGYLDEKLQIFSKKVKLEGFK